MFPSYICQMPPDANVEAPKEQDDYIKASLFAGPKSQTVRFSYWPRLVHIWMAYHPFFSFIVCLSFAHSCYCLPSHAFMSLEWALIKIASFLVRLLSLLFSSITTNGDAVLFLFPRGHKLKKSQTVKEYLDVTDISLWKTLLTLSLSSLARLCIKGSLLERTE